MDASFFTQYGSISIKECHKTILGSECIGYRLSLYNWKLDMPKEFWTKNKSGIWNYEFYFRPPEKALACLDIPQLKFYLATWRCFPRLGFKDCGNDVLCSVDFNDYYSREYIKILGAKWDKAKKIWVLPRNEMVLGALTSMQRVRAIDEQEHRELVAAIPKDVLFDYQVDNSYFFASCWLDGIPGALLSDNVGMGKTTSAFGYALACFDAGLVSTAILLSEKSYISQGDYRRDFDRFCRSDIELVDLSSNKNLDLDDNNKKILVCTHHRVSSLKKHRPEFFSQICSKMSNTLLIIDEVSRCNNKTTKIFKDVAVLSSGAAFTLCLSATPQTNNIGETHNIMTLIDPSIYPTYMFESNHVNLKKKTVTRQGKKWSFATREYKEQNKFENIVSPYITGTDHSDISFCEDESNERMPKIDFKISISPLTPAERNIENKIFKYHQYNCGISSDIDNWNFLRLKHKDVIVLNAYQICLNSPRESLKYGVTPSYMPEYSSRFKSLQEILNSHHEDRILIFSHFRSTIEYLSSHIKNRVVFTGDGSYSTKSRRLLVEQFKNTESSILICSDAFSRGLNMQFADVVVNYDLTWTPTALTQRAGRICRIGANSDKTIYTLLSPSIVDYAKLKILLKKGDSFKSMYQNNKMLEEFVALFSCVEETIYDGLTDRNLSLAI